MTKVELTWTGKGERPPADLLPLVEDPDLSYRSELPGSCDNLIIQGDNLHALRALEAGQVRCAVIDPPYNTGSSFQHYDDGVEHAAWLSSMRDRLEAIRTLLSDLGSLWIFIDDNEAHYLKVLCDEVFGRSNFIADIAWEKTYTPKSNGRGLSTDHDHILVFSKTDRWRDEGWNFLPRTAAQRARFSNPDQDPEGPWRTYPLDVRTEHTGRREKYRYPVTTPAGRVVRPAPGRHWAYPEDRFNKERAAGRIYFGKNGDGMPTKKVYLKHAREGVLARTWWPHKQVGHNQEAKREILALFGDSGFITPKPERVVQRILTIATDPGDRVLDCFAGTGTTGAVAHKMGRRWIMVEQGEHARTHVAARLRKVIDAEDPGGITEATSWEGGGGFRFLRLS